MPEVLTDAEMNAISDELIAAGVMPDSCVIKRPSTGRDAGGAPLSGGESTVATVACRVGLAGTASVERVMGGRFGPDADYLVALPRGTDVQTDDAIEVNGMRLDVIYAARPSFHVAINVACRATT